MYGDPLDYMPEVMELCLNCRYADCFGQEGCSERQRLIRKIRAEIGAVNMDIVRPDLKAEYTIDGVTLSGWEWIRRRGLKPSTVYMRMLKGMGFEEALRKQRIQHKTKRGFLYTVDGVTRTGADWEKLLGLSKSSLAKRARKSREDAIEFIREKLSKHEDGKV